MLDKLIYGAIGFLLGGMLGGAIVGRIVTNDMKKRLDDVEEQNKKLIDENVELREKKYEERKTKVEKQEKEEKLDNYNSLRKRYITSSDDEPDESEMYDTEDAQDKYDRIKIISEQRFNEEINYRDHEGLTYFQVDGTLVNASNDIIIKEEEIIGSEAMDIIDDTKNDYLYVLDEDEDKLYDITIEHDASYMRDVLGIGG